MSSSISQPISALSQRVFNHGHVSHINSQEASHILCMNLQACAIVATLQQEKCTHFQTIHLSQSFKYIDQFWHIPHDTFIR